MATHAQQQFHGNSDRIIPRCDKNGNPVLFLADTYDAETITMWDGGEPQKVTMEFYHTTKPLNGGQIDKITKNYQRTFGNEILVMQRLPRVLMDAPILRKKEQPKDTGKEFIENLKNPVPEKDATELYLEHHGERRVDPIEQKPQLQSYVMRKLGDFWKIINHEGLSVAYAVSEEDALQMLKSLLGNSPLMH